MYEDLIKRIEALENKVNSQSPLLLNFSDAANYIGINHFWLKFLIDHKLIRLTFLPGFKKPKIYKKNLDDFVEDIQLNKNEYIDIFLKANKLFIKRYSKFKDQNDC